jgi:tetratricopeptide (TPR) repeat protein
VNKHVVSIGLLAVIALTSGCQTAPQRQAEKATAQPVSLPFAEPEQVARELDEDLIYNYLVGEIGAYRGELRTAQTHYQTAASLAQDAYAAQRATRIALHLKDYQAGLAAVRRWVALAPNDMTARQLAAVLFLRDEDLEAAGEQLDALVKIADAKNLDGFLQAASALSVERDQAGAEQLIVALHERHPDDIRSLYAVAVLETAHGRFDLAEERLNAVIDALPDWEQPRVLLSRVMVAQERRDDAIALLDESVDDFPDSVLLRTTYSRLLVDAADYAEALKQFKALHKLAPDDEEIAFGYAMLATQQSQWDEARSMWQMLRSSGDRRNEASYYLAQIEEEAGNEDLAIGLYRSVSGDELKVDAMMRTAQIYGRTGRLPEAREVLQLARIANPGRAADLYIVETQIVQRFGSADDAMALYDTAVAAFPDNHDLRYNRALFLIAQDDFDGMERALRAILDEDPDHVDSLNALGYTMADRNMRLDEAYVYISRALKLRPDNAAILDSMGWVLYRQGELVKAADYLRRALVLAEEDDEIAAHLGEVLWIKGLRADAREVWREALVHTPDSDKVKSVLERLQVDW